MIWLPGLDYWQEDKGQFWHSSGYQKLLIQFWHSPGNALAARAWLLARTSGTALAGLWHTVLAKLWQKLCASDHFCSGPVLALLWILTSGASGCQDCARAGPVHVLCWGRMVNARLVHSLESTHAFSDEQCGFRKGRSTTDHLVRFETFVRESFAKEKHVVSVLFWSRKGIYATT